MQRFVLLIVLLALFFINAHAQSDFRPGYIITNSMDTIQGWLDYRGEIRSMKRCTFKPSLEEPAKDYEAEKIYGYRFNNGKFFISKSIETEQLNDTVFVEFLLKGITNLYYYTSIDYSAYFIESSDNELLELRSKEIEIEKDGKVYIKNDNRYLGILNIAFADCSELKKDIINTNLTHKALINLTRRYHDYKCDDEACVIYEKRLPVLSVNLIPFAGYGLSKKEITGSELQHFDFDNSPSVVFGLGLNFTIPRVNEKISLFTTFQINRDHYQGTYIRDLSFKYEYHRADIKNTRLITGIGAQYTYPKGKFRPYMAIGPYKEWSLSGEAYNHVNSFLEGDIPKGVEVDELTEVNQPKIGLIIKTGGIFQIQNLRAFVDISYLSGKGSKGDNVKVEEFSKTIQFTTGIIF